MPCDVVIAFGGLLRSLFVCRPRRGPGLGDGADRLTRIPPGHLEGCLEGFANLYQDIACELCGESTDMDIPAIAVGMDGVWFIEACQESATAKAVWEPRNVPASSCSPPTPSTSRMPVSAGCGKSVARSK